MKSKHKYTTIILIILLAVALIWAFQELKSRDTEILNLTQQIEGQQKLILEIQGEVRDLQSNLSLTSEKLKIEQQQRQRLERDILELKRVNSSEYAVIGINPYGRGVVIPLKVEIKNGGGKVLLNIANIYFDTYLQNSAQKAVEVAQEITKFNLSDKDISIIMTAPAAEKSEIAGESGGAAICAAIVAAIQNKTIDKKVLITGTIEEDHTIGRVGAVHQKALAAKESGAAIFIVPAGQKVWVEELEILDILTIENALKYVIKDF